MSPLKIIVLLLLFYLLYRLFTAGRRKIIPGSGPRDRPPLDHDVLVEDPVCHTYIPKGQAIALQQEDKIHYFCSEKCCRVFLTHPDQKKGENG